MAAIIPGKKKIMEGFSIVSQNISNPRPLSIVVREGNLKQDMQNLNRLFILDQGLISIKGENIFHPFKKIEHLNKSLPIKGPELTSIDQTEIFRTGEIQVVIRQGGALIILS